MRQYVALIPLILSFSSSFQTGLSNTGRENHYYPGCLSGSSTATEEPEHSHQYVAKTIESFKLADLYLAEAHVTAYCNHQKRRAQLSKNAPNDLLATTTVSDLAFHRGTASYLLGCTTSQVEPSMLDLPFRASRIQYAGRVLAAEATVEDFLIAIKCHFDKDAVQNATWVLDYDTFEPLSNDLQKGNFKPSMLMCAVSRLLHGEPTITTERDVVEKAEKYKIIETKNRLYLTKMMTGPTDETRPRESQTCHASAVFKTKWARRPFQYSGAFNLDAAFAVVDILRDLTVPKQGRVKLLDPTCGSGSFLALALHAWADSVSVRAVGVDSNPKCSEGSLRNLKHVFDKCNSSGGNTLQVGSASSATMHCADSSDLSSIIEGPFDCAVANLPWNRNTFELEDLGSNERILESVSSLLSPGAPFVVVSGGMAGQDESDADGRFNARGCLEKLGMRVLTTACIPPRGFNLPSSSKRKVGLPKHVARSSDCTVTIAIR